jgi:hypothetical protein
MQIAEEIAELRSSVFNSPEIVEVTDQWSVCMNEAGFDVADRNEAIRLVWAERAEADEFVSRFLGSTVLPTEAEVREFEDLAGPLEEFEVAVVEADILCANATGETDVRRSMLWEAETAWLEANNDRVALLLAEIGGR